MRKAGQWAKSELTWWENWLCGGQVIDYPYWMGIIELGLKCRMIHYQLIVHWKDMRGKKGKNKTEQNKTKAADFPNLSEGVVEC